MNVSVRYWLFQLPGILLIAIVTSFSVYMNWISGKTMGWVLLGWVLKDMLLYPITIASYKIEDPHQKTRLVEEKGEVIVALNPQGTIRLRGERWKATTESGEHLPIGTKVIVCAHKGLDLWVRPLHEESDKGS